MNDGKFAVDLDGRDGTQASTPNWATPYTDAKVSLENLSKGPVEITTDYGTFRVGFMQLGMDGTGKGFTRPVRMLNNVPEQRRTETTDDVNNTNTRQSTMSGHGKVRQSAMSGHGKVRQSATSGHGKVRQSATSGHSKVRQPATSALQREQIRRRLLPVDFQCDIANDCVRGNTTDADWKSYESGASAKIHANFVTGPVKPITTAHGTFMIGLMQVTLGNRKATGYGCVRPVRMNDGKFAVDLDGRDGTQASTPNWATPYTDAKISLENLS